MCFKRKYGQSLDGNATGKRHEQIIEQEKEQFPFTYSLRSTCKAEHLKAAQAAPEFPVTVTFSYLSL